jgi:hypothetical protein
MTLSSPFPIALDHAVLSKPGPDGVHRTDTKEWIKSQFKEAKLLERKAKGVTEITVEISSEETLEANAKSSPLTLKNLKMRHLKGELHLSDHEYRALSDWLNKSSGGKRDK